ncbi:hypothetical protein P692DRAFT_20837436, partial [Suillus brevipes Sb2]
MVGPRGRVIAYDVWITAHLVLCSRSRLPFYRRFQNTSRAGTARNRAKRCIVHRSAGPGVGVDNEYVCMMCSNRSSNGINPTLNSQTHAHNATRISKLPA